MNFVAQIIGVFAISLWVISIQNKSRDKILMFQFWSNILYMIEYAMLGAYSASVMNLTSSVRCLVFSKSKKSSGFSFVILFSLIIILLGVFTYDGVLSLIPIFIALIYTISSWFKNVFWNRVFVIASAFIWIYYNLRVCAYITIVGNVFEIISGIISLIRYRKWVLKFLTIGWIGVIILLNFEKWGYIWKIKILIKNLLL